MTTNANAVNSYSIIDIVTMAETSSTKENYSFEVKPTTCEIILHEVVKPTVKPTTICEEVKPSVTTENNLIEIVFNSKPTVIS